TQDLLIGSTATNSATSNYARAAFLNIAGGTPTASLSAGIAGGAFFTADGQLQTTAKQNLTLGGGNSGNITLSPTAGTDTLSLNLGTLTVNGAPGSTTGSPSCVTTTNGIVTGVGTCRSGSGGSVWDVS